MLKFEGLTLIILSLEKSLHLKSYLKEFYKKQL